MPRHTALQAGQEGSQQQPLLGLAHIVLGLGLREALLTQKLEPPLHDLLAGRADQPAGHVLQHHRLQGKAACSLSPLDETAPAQPIHGFQDLCGRERSHQHRLQLLQRHRLAQDGQPPEQRLFQRREPLPLLLQELGDTAKEDRACGEERGDSPAKEVGDGLGHDGERQRVARVEGCQAGVLLWGADQLVLAQQLRAGRGLQPREAQGAHEGAPTLQGAQRGRVLAAGQQQAALVPRVADLLQQLPIALVTRTQPPQRLACFEQRFQVIEHQQHAKASQFRQQPAQAPLQALLHEILRLGGQHRQAGREQRFRRRGVAQGAKEHHVEVGGQLAHGLHHQRGLADAAQAQHAHHPAVVLHHPLGERGQFPLAPKEARYIQRVPPIQEWSTESLGSACDRPSRGWTLSWR